MTKLLWEYHMGSYAHSGRPVPVHSHFFLERLSGEVRPLATGLQQRGDCDTIFEGKLTLAAFQRLMLLFVALRTVAEALDGTNGVS
jgi:hypothetical protein